MKASTVPPSSRLARRALLVVAALALSEVLAQAMLGRPVMAQLLSPSLWALPALVVVLVSLVTRLALIVVLPSACAAYLVWFALRRLSAAPRAARGARERSGSAAGARRSPPPRARARSSSPSR